MSCQQYCCHSTVRVRAAVKTLKQAIKHYEVALSGEVAAGGKSLLQREETFFLCLQKIKSSVRRVSV